MARSSPSMPGARRARSTSAAADVPSRGDDPHLRAVGAQVADQLAGVDAAAMPGHAVAREVGVERLLRRASCERLRTASGPPCPPRAGRRDSRRRGLVPTLPISGYGHGDDLAHVGRVGEDLLVAGHRGVEDHLAHRLAGRRRSPPLEDRPVRQRQDCARFIIVSPRAGSNTIRPAHHGRASPAPCTFRPWKGVFRLLDWNRAASTVHSASGVDHRHVGRRARGQVPAGQPEGARRARR